jgi:hypothetical protein
VPKPPSVPTSSGGPVHPPPDSSSNSSTCHSGPVRRRTTTTTTAVTADAMGAVTVIAVVMVATAAPTRIRVQTHLGLPSSTLVLGLFRCARVPGVLDSRLRASAGQSSLCATFGATSCPPWAHAADGIATTWTNVEPVDLVLGPAVPRQLFQHHDVEPSLHHGLDC